MDEVDGMSGGDRGGIQDLMATIASSKIPIICICNDKYNQKLRSLRNKVRYKGTGLRYGELLFCGIAFLHLAGIVTKIIWRGS